MSALIRSKRVLHAQHDMSDAHQIVFQHDDDTGDPYCTAIDLPAAYWEDFGRPDTITITIEPGDHLNGPDA